MCIPTETSGLKSRLRQVQAASNEAGRSRRVLAGSGGLGGNVGAGRFQRVPAGPGGFACTVKVLKKALGVRHLD